MRGAFFFRFFLGINIVIFFVNIEHIVRFRYSTKNPNSNILHNFEKKQKKLPKKKLWCVLQYEFLPRHQRLHFHRFQFALEAILHCYSNFLMEKAITTQNDTIIHANCGFMIDTLVSTPERIPSFILEIISHMGCELKYFNSQSRVSLYLNSDQFFNINLYKLMPRYNFVKYLNRPEHAHYLRRQFINDTDIMNIKGKGKQLQIGVVTSTGKLWSNLLDDVYEYFPNANITIFEKKKLKDSILWFASKDIILGPHNENFVHSLWITPGTVVLQMYPTGYYLPLFESLIEQVGGVALQWFERGTLPEVQRSPLNERSIFFNRAGLWWNGFDKNFSSHSGEVLKQIKAVTGKHPHFRFCNGFVDSDAKLPYPGWYKNLPRFKKEQF